MLKKFRFPISKGGTGKNKANILDQTSDSSVYDVSWHTSHRHYSNNGHCLAEQYTSNLNKYENGETRTELVNTVRGQWLLALYHSPNITSEASFNTSYRVHIGGGGHLIYRGEGFTKNYFYRVLPHCIGDFTDTFPALEVHQQINFIRNGNNKIVIPPGGIYFAEFEEENTDNAKLYIMMAHYIDTRNAVDSFSWGGWSNGKRQGWIYRLL